MSKRLEILFSQERNPHPLFTTEELEETLEITAKEVKALADKESWRTFEKKEVSPDGKIETVLYWDALSMPVATRKRIARMHHIEEEDSRPLVEEAEEEAAHVQAIFPWADADVVADAVFYARMFTYARDVVFSLRLPLMDALEVMCHSYGTTSYKLSAFNQELDNGNPCSFILLDEDTRFAVLLLYFMRQSGLLPKISADLIKESATTQVH